MTEKLSVDPGKSSGGKAKAMKVSHEPLRHDISKMDHVKS